MSDHNSEDPIVAAEEQARSRDLWAREVARRLALGEMTEEEAEILRSWDRDAINGVQWSGGDLTDIFSHLDAEQAVAETLAFQRAA